jgi:Calx-beta domain/Beta-propeller repeat
MNNEFNESNQFSLDKVADFSNFGLDSHNLIDGTTEKDFGGMGNPPEHLDVEKWENKPVKRQADPSKPDPNHDNVYFAGYTEGDFAGNSAGGQDVWVAKYGSNGEQIWTKQFGSSEDDRSFGIATDSSSNVYFTGITRGDLAGTNAGGADLWTAKINPETQPQVSITATDPNAAETLDGKTPNPGEFTITRTGETTDPLTVNYSIDGKAINGEDYQKLTGSIIIAAGETTVSLPIEAIDNEKSEYSEKVNLTLEPNFFYGVDTNKSATVTIADNDKPVISIRAIDVKAKETKEGEVTNPAKFKVRRAGNLTGSLKVNYTVDGTATKDTDYQLPSKIIFAAGMDSVDLEMSIVDDAVVEGTEAATVNLRTATGYKVSQTNSAKVSIADNDK